MYSNSTQCSLARRAVVALIPPIHPTNDKTPTKLACLLLATCYFLLHVWSVSHDLIVNLARPPNSHRACLRLPSDPKHRRRHQPLYALQIAYSVRIPWARIRPLLEENGSPLRGWLSKSKVPLPPSALLFGCFVALRSGRKPLHLPRLARSVMPILGPSLASIQDKLHCIVGVAHRLLPGLCALLPGLPLFYDFSPKSTIGLKHLNAQLLIGNDTSRGCKFDWAI